MSKIINILIAIDTDAVVKKYPGGGSKDPTKPSGLEHTMGYMICTGAPVNSGQGTGDLDFNALVGDSVRAFATSGSDNFEAAVLLYGMPKFTGDDVFGKFVYERFEKKTVAPNSPDPLPALLVDEVFWFFEANVVKKGAEGYSVQFGLYLRDQTTGDPVLQGYYYWDPMIRVAG